MLLLIAFVAALAVILLLCVLLFCMYFNRYPHIDIDKTLPPHAVVSPAYGTVIEVTTTDDECEIVIFLSPFDIHHQFFPIDCRVSSVIYDRTGRFEIASHAEKSRANEKIISTLETPHGNVVVKQIAGKIVRGIVFRKRTGDKAQRGDLLGQIKLGSRVDIVLPKTFVPRVKSGDKVYGPETVLGHFM